MTTTNTYNPLLRAFRELTTPNAFRWYRTQAKSAATLVNTIAIGGFTKAKQLLSDRKPVVIAAVADTEVAITPSVVELENVIAMPSAIAQTETITQTIAPVEQNDGDTVEMLENAIAPSQEYAFTEAIEPAESATFYDWEPLEANATFATVQAEAIAPTNEPEQCDRIAMDEEAIANDSATGATEAQDWVPDDAIAAVAFSEAGMQGFGEAIASDGDTFAWVDDVPLDEDPTELRQWAEARVLESAISQTPRLDEPEEDDTFFAAEPEQAEDFADDADDEADELE